MKITQDLRVEAERMAGMEQKSKEFAEKGKEIYLPGRANNGASVTARSGATRRTPPSAELARDCFVHSQ